MFFALLSRLLKARRPLRSAAVDIEIDAQEPVLGCGWFDSSHELRHGLQVTEHATPDAVASELPLTDWLELHLNGWRAPCVG